jgi:calcineurin-like phosphoesterase family protein
VRHLYLQPLAVGNIKINYAFQSVSDIIIIGEWDWTKDFMGSIYMISDTHFGDAGAILKYEGRPFKDGHEMNEQMIENWNRVVGAEDTVYHLGDFACGMDVDGMKAILGRLNGYKVLIAGNHDRDFDSRSWMDMGFDEVSFLPVILDEFFILSHEPMYVNIYSPYANIFGHVHNNPMYTDVSERSFCACVERIGYAPAAFEAIRKGILEADRKGMEQGR